MAIYCDAPFSTGAKSKCELTKLVSWPPGQWNMVLSTVDRNSLVRIKSTHNHIPIVYIWSRKLVFVAHELRRWWEVSSTAKFAVFKLRGGGVFKECRHHLGLSSWLIEWRAMRTKGKDLERKRFGYISSQLFASFYAVMI